MKKNYTYAGRIIASLTSSMLATSMLATTAAQLPVSDGKPADMSKPVQEFIIMGQSNTLEMGRVSPVENTDSLEHAVKKEGLYPYLVDADGNWTIRQDVRNVSVMQKKRMNVYRNDWLTLSGGKFGIEIGIGHHLGHAIDAPVMVLKSSIGNRALGWALLPPGSESWEYEDPKTGKTYIHAGYKQSPSRWEKGTEPKPMGWYAGKQYDDDVGNAKKILADLDKYYPGAKGPLRRQGQDLHERRRCHGCGNRESTEKITLHP